MDARVERAKPGEDPLARWESLVERQIREATAEGKFDDLPHQGAPLPLEDDTAAGDRAMAHRMLRNAGMAPPWIEADKAVRELLEQRDRQLAQASRVSPISWSRVRDRYAAVIDELDRAITRLNAEAPTDRQHRRPLDRAAEMAAFDARRDAG